MKKIGKKMFIDDFIDIISNIKRCQNQNKCLDKVIQLEYSATITNVMLEIHVSTSFVLKSFFYQGNF